MEKAPEAVGTQKKHLILLLMGEGIGKTSAVPQLCLELFIFNFTL